jgi:hypothetical protein
MIQFVSDLHIYVVDPPLTTGTAKLAIATTDGAVLTLDVLRRANLAEGTWDLELGELQPVITADGRVMTALQFVEVDSTVLLVWAKSGSVHFKHPSWPSPKMVRLRRVGNWAGCNALGTCVGELCRPPSSADSQASM